MQSAGRDCCAGCSGSVRVVPASGAWVAGTDVGELIAEVYSRVHEENLKVLTEGGPSTRTVKIGAGLPGGAVG
ncbi:hypothetical protein GCM10008939_00960 [Deinococcus aquiradiocola]|uniref:Uncharacterized protein n=1 Tax=Deinococcus aquiradiocola TaxID=393059 RepID=A0A917P4B0_9DEIO|nr:hypothetical protein GCM10008939_00960 [Deinococcus aquiradiocola]